MPRQPKPVLAGAFLAPSLVGLSAFFLVPLLDVIRRSFTTSTGADFAGLDNYTAVLGNEAFRMAAGNTAKFVAVCVPLLLAFSLAIALLLCASTPFKRLMKTAFLLPLAVPVFTTALLVSVTFDAQGIANGILDLFGIDPVAWLTSDAAFWVLVASYLWRNLGYCIVLWLAALSCIPESLYDAARIDGANSAQIAARITLPLLAPSGAVVAILALANAFKVYREAYLVAGSYPHESMYLLPHLFNNWFASLSVAKLAAGGVVLGIVLSVVVCVLFRLWSKQEQVDR
ncbi:carbohydrate ABC transporter permease [Raoultibacter phocaeensis]|uniref:carbohydrate ABC transporter permease n=1 Tax=Raoultibacter phocaeensis TaxID=2479841 RepID=UPI00111AE630|nr:sugar ABC transporter permease [Raoultibacter phocaeensis]